MFLTHRCQMRGLSKDSDWVKLSNAANEIQAQIITTLLATGGIPAVTKMIDAPLVGINLARGVDILVPKEKLEEARLLIETPVEEALEKQIEEAEKESVEELIKEPVQEIDLEEPEKESKEK